MNEKYDVMAFFLDAVEPSEKSKVSTNDLFKAYNNWRIGQEMKETEISLDSFGRYIPDHYTKRIISRNGELSRGLMGVKLRHA